MFIYPIFPPIGNSATTSKTLFYLFLLCQRFYGNYCDTVSVHFLWHLIAYSLFVFSFISRFLICLLYPSSIYLWLNGPFRPLCLYWSHFKTVNEYSCKICLWLDLNSRSLVTEATVLPSEPQPLPSSVYFFFFQYFYSYFLCILPISVSVSISINLSIYISINISIYINLSASFSINLCFFSALLLILWISLFLFLSISLLLILCIFLSLCSYSMRLFVSVIILLLYIVVKSFVKNKTNTVKNSSCLLSRWASIR